jgi:type IV secretory pathway TraG/TraD family ATPase VirD4
LNKVGQFLATATIRNIVGQYHSRINIREIMDQKKILIVNLSRGKIGEDNSALLGAMMITKIQLAAMSRADVTIDKRPDCFLYVDEFQNFATDSFSVILSEARKYNLCLTMANQYIEQMPDSVRSAVLATPVLLLLSELGGQMQDFWSRSSNLCLMQMIW